MTQQRGLFLTRKEIVMEGTERDQQLFEEFIHDYNLSEEDIREIESNAKFKEYLQSVLSDTVQVENKVLVWYTVYHSAIHLRLRHNNDYGLSKNLWDKLFNHWPGNNTMAELVELGPWPKHHKDWEKRLREKFKVQQ
jgi:hypothetical protein